MAQIDFSKQKYIDIAKNRGLQVAINQLHEDLWEVEQVTFDTPEGFQADLWKTLNEMRIFSRELWDLKLV